MFFESSGLVHLLTNQCTSPLDSEKTSGIISTNVQVLWTCYALNLI
jgi:hypothetical protein